MPIDRRAALLGDDPTVPAKSSGEVASSTQPGNRNGGDGAGCYVVSCERRRWQFEIDGELFGPYSTEQDAIAAVREDVGLRGHAASPTLQIRLRTARGEWRELRLALTARAANPEGEES